MVGGQGWPGLPGGPGGQGGQGGPGGQQFETVHNLVEPQWKPQVGSPTLGVFLTSSHLSGLSYSLTFFFFHFLGGSL